ncbi:unnamed protein product [Notodromas monacha]|uniref:Uncharacterized protein n=1 Tax=Notodromas monacha TaxID=399045 RepID=A0A7R9GE34_9CRUS|nr:unnamed protein product [Notodromas monacha]CAG0917614.1 unnamed protein product [Notodromas monacha]
MDFEECGCFDPALDYDDLVNFPHTSALSRTHSFPNFVKLSECGPGLKRASSERSLAGFSSADGYDYEGPLIGTRDGLEEIAWLIVNGIPIRAPRWFEDGLKADPTLFLRNLAAVRVPDLKSNDGHCCGGLRGICAADLTTPFDLRIYDLDDKLREYKYGFPEDDVPVAIKTVPGGDINRWMDDLFAQTDLDSSLSSLTKLDLAAVCCSGRKFMVFRDCVYDVSLCADLFPDETMVTVKTSRWHQVMTHAAKNSYLEPFKVAELVTETEKNARDSYRLMEVSRADGDKDRLSQKNSILKTDGWGTPNYQANISLFRVRALPDSLKWASVRLLVKAVAKSHLTPDRMQLSAKAYTKNMCPAQEPSFPDKKSDNSEPVEPIMDLPKESFLSFLPSPPPCGDGVEQQQSTPRFPRVDAGNDDVSTLEMLSTNSVGGGAEDKQSQTEDVSNVVFLPPGLDVVSGCESREGEWRQSGPALRRRFRPSHHQAKPAASELYYEDDELMGFHERFQTMGFSIQVLIAFGVFCALLVFAFKHW